MKKVIIVAVSDPVSKRLLTTACEPEMKNEAFDRLSWRLAEELVNEEKRNEIFEDYPDEKGISFGDMKSLIEKRRNEFEYTFSEEEEEYIEKSDFLEN